MTDIELAALIINKTGELNRLLKEAQSRNMEIDFEHRQISIEINTPFYNLIRVAKVSMPFSVLDTGDNQ